MSSSTSYVCSVKKHLLAAVCWSDPAECSQAFPIDCRHDGVTKWLTVALSKLRIINRVNAVRQVASTQLWHCTLQEIMEGLDMPCSPRLPDSSACYGPPSKKNRKYKLFSGTTCVNDILLTTFHKNGGPFEL